MNRLTQRQVRATINVANCRLLDAMRAYRPYQPSLDHGDALRNLAEAEQFIRQAAELILAAQQTTKEDQP